MEKGQFYDEDSTDEDTKALEARTRSKRMDAAKEIRTARMELLAKYVKAYGKKEDALAMMKKHEALTEDRRKAKERSEEKRGKERGRPRPPWSRCLYKFGM